MFRFGCRLCQLVTRLAARTSRTGMPLSLYAAPTPDAVVELRRSLSRRQMRFGSDDRRSVMSDRLPTR